MKKSNLVILILTLLFGISGCTNDQNNSQDQGSDSSDKIKNLPPIKGPESVAGIEKLIKKIDAEKDSMEMVGPNYVFDGQQKTEVFAYSQDQLPQLIYTISGGTERWYYLLDRRPVFLKELIASEKEFVQNHFYYGTKNLIQADSRNAKTKQELNTAEVRSYPGNREDFQLSGEATTAKVLEFLYGKMK